MSLVLRTDDGAVRTLTLNDVDGRNRLSTALTTELVAACDDADRDDSVRVVVLTNNGNTFCAGADLRGPSADGAPSDAIDPTRLFGRFAQSPKVWVGRINGHCVAGGMGLLAGLDITVAPTTAKFGFTEVRVGVAPAMISVVCLKKMRLGDAQAAFLRGRRFSAEETVALGLLTYATAPEALDETVHEIVTDLLHGGPGALAATKRLLNEVPGMTTADAFQMTRELSGQLFRSDEAREGMTAFMEKRRPSWATPEEA